MICYLQIEFSDGTIRACNIRAHGVKSADEKARIIVNWLEKPGARELVRWEIFYRRSRPGMEFTAVRGNVVKGLAFFATWLRREDLAK